MLEFRFYFLPLVWAFSLYVTFLLFTIDWIIALIFLGLTVVAAGFTVHTYLRSIWWPYHSWIDLSLVDIKEVKIPSSTNGLSLNGLILRDKKADPNEKQPGILFSHGYTGFKEKTFKYTIPLVLNGFTVLCMDLRGHGTSKAKGFDMDDIPSIMADVKKEIDFLAQIKNIDTNRLMMIGHSMGAMATLSEGYADPRLKIVVGMSGAYDLLDVYEKHNNWLLSLIKKRITKDLEGPLEEWNDKISPKAFMAKGSPNNIPDKDRVFLVHSKNDQLINVEGSLQTIEALNLPEENVLLLDAPEGKYLNSAHELVGQAPIIAGFLLKVSEKLKSM